MPDSSWEREPALRHPTTSTPNTTAISSREWIPASFRKSRAFPFAILCLLFVVCLEVLDILVRRNHGLPADNQNSFRAAKYLPTIGVVALGFAWKALVGDIKNITPWSQMSIKWSKGSHSVLLDYITNIEVTSLIHAGRNGHWLVFAALTIGFLCGASVSLANSLVFIDLFSHTSVDTTFTEASQFFFNNALELSNGTLPIPFDHLGAAPYAAVASQRLPNGRFAPWTKDVFAFDSFGAASENLPRNSTIEATVKAFSTDFNCHSLNYSWEDGDFYHQLEADASDIPGLNCSLPIRQNFTTESDSPLRTNVKAWLNVTACAPNTTENLLIGTILSLEENRDCTGRTSCNEGDVFYNTTDVLGLVCSPKFFMQDALVSTNASTGEVTSYQLREPRDEIDIQTSVSAQWLYLSNPLDAKLQTIYGVTYKLPTGSPPVAAGYWIINAVEAISQSNITVDPFFTLLVDGQQQSSVEAYLQNSDRLQPDLETLGSNVLAEVVSAFAREDVSSKIPGKISVTGPRFFIRQASLRALQAILIIIGCAAVMYATIVRPRSILREDPGSLAATAIILSHSNPEVEQILARESTSTAKHMQDLLGPGAWLLRHHGSAVALDLQHHVGLPQEKPLSPSPSGSTNHSGWRPMPFHLASKIALVFALIAVMVVLAVLLRISQTNDGVCRNTTATSNAFAFVPTTILVLIGYACSGVDGAARTISSYKTLWNMSGPRQPKNSERQPLLQNLRDVPTIAVPFRATKASSYGFSLTASSTAILLIPVVKIVAAGLYGVTMSVTTATVQSAVDTSIVTHLESTYDNGDSYLSVQRASQFAEWSRTPSLNVPRRAGILDNIVFSNLTSAGNFSQSQDLSNSTIDAEVPAISVDVKCTSVDMVLDAQYMDTRDCWNFSPNCDSQQCSDLIFAGDPSSYTNLQGDGGSCSGSRPPFVGLTGFGPSAYRVVLLDYSSIDGPITNVTPWGSTKNYTTYNLTTGTVGPSVLNVSLPTVLATSCALSLTAITLHTTYSFSLSDATWNPSSYAPSSIANARPFNATALPSWLRPYAYAANGTTLLDLNDLTLEAPGRLYSQSLWPTRGASLNFFELLAAHATYALGDVRALLDKRNFTSAVEAMMAAYATEMLTEVRGAAAAANAAAAPARVGATLRSAQSRIVQDRGSTVAVEALLALLLACVGWVFLRFPSSAVLPKSPGSVAVRMSLLAGSGLVGELRARGAGRAEDVRGVTGRAGLGWWEGRGEEGVGGRRRRWGVDVGEGVVHRGWNDPPVEFEMVPVSPGRSLVSSMSSMSARGSDEELTGGAMRTRPGSESSGVTVISE